MKLTLIEKKIETPSVTSFIFHPQEPIVWKAGQFFHYVLHHRPTDERGSDRWFTIASAPFEKKIMITTRITQEKGSSFKKALVALKEGEEIEISDLDGEFILEDLEKEYVFLAGGIGITPFHAILKQLDHEKKSPHITLLYANKDHEVAYKEELEQFAKNNPNLSIHYIFSPQHIDETTIRHYVADIKTPLFYMSGPEPMVESLGDMLEKMGVVKDNIQQDFFPGYPAE